MTLIEKLRQEATYIKAVQNTNKCVICGKSNGCQTVAEAAACPNNPKNKIKKP